MNQWAGESQFAARVRDILTSRYVTAHTSADALAVILLLHRALEDAITVSLGQAAAGLKDMAAKIEALAPQWPADLSNQLRALNVRRKDLAHPRFINGPYAHASAEAFVDFCLDHWPTLFQSQIPPPAVTHPRWHVAPATQDDGDISRRLRSILAIEYAQAQTPSDMLAALLLFHKAIEERMEQLGGARSNGVKAKFEQKVDAVFHDSNAHRTLMALHRARSDLAHPVALNDGQIIRTADALADFVAEQWSILGDRQRLIFSRPPLSAAYALSSPRETTPQEMASQAERKQGRERRPFAWGTLLSVAAQAALALWLLGVARSLWDYWPGEARWPAAVAGMLVLFFAYRATQAAAALLDRTGNVRGGLALLGLLVLGMVLWLVTDWPPDRRLSGRYAGQLLTAFVAGLTAGEAAPVPVPLQTVAPPARATATLPAAAPDAPDAPAAPTNAPTAVPTDTAPPAIAVGETVRVVTQGNNLNGRAEPGLGSAVVASFANGASLVVVDGPREVDGYIWWLVRGDAGDGWSAADFLATTEEQ